MPVRETGSINFSSYSDAGRLRILKHNSDAPLTTPLFIYYSRPAGLTLSPRHLLFTVQLMTNHQFDLRVGETICLGDYKVSLLEADETEGDVVLEIEGPDGDISVTPFFRDDCEVEELVCV